ncbi:hypothetical protein CAPTEDRAFT_193761 [Capitella teleta]|uniref:DNA polymerase delta subunit 4 n=1 Tax=Capitella teleta TaxID=283909 RepID=R7V9M6_CAPTE|nr:hypothetical protein CAPTEDRAFT_193761 [Capitella teleta]|eukprot:ELU15284.1 hypothetical protein CAPTEDRAFT_193761 [Capitella teleta]
MASKITGHFKVIKTSDPSTSKKKSKCKVEIIDDDTPIIPLNKDLEYLRQFDLDFQYGPCTGITRLERWQRAEKFGLNPPVAVRDLINSHCHDNQYTCGLVKTRMKNAFSSYILVIFSLWQGFEI